MRLAVTDSDGGRGRLEGGPQESPGEKPCGAGAPAPPRAPQRAGGTLVIISDISRRCVPPPKTNELISISVG